MNTSSRDITIDIVKGICIILMVIGHSGTPQWLRDSIYMFHMPCFFIISGYLFKNKYVSDIKNFLLRKGKTIWKPFLIWTLIFLALHNIFTDLHFYKEYYSVKQVLTFAIKAVFMLKTEQLLGGFWFLIALLFASIISVLWYKIIKFSKVWILTGIIIMLGVSFVLLFLKFNIYFFSYRNFLATAYFMLGTLLRLTLFSENNLTQKLQVTIITLSMILLVIGTILIPVDMLTLTAPSLLPYFIISSTISVSLIIVCSLLTPSAPIKWLTKVGERTLDILIFHFLIFKTISFIKIIHYEYDINRLSDFPVIQENNSFYWILYSILGIFGSLILASAINLSIRKMNNSWKKLKPGKTFQ